MHGKAHIFKYVGIHKYFKDFRLGDNFFFKSHFYWMVQLKSGTGQRPEVSWLKS
jgi:hypothetical protein